MLEEGLSGFDLLVSNPPYIPQSEAQAMNSNVVDYEPDRALFVPDSDALLFYRRLLELAKETKMTALFMWPLRSMRILVNK